MNIALVVRIKTLFEDTLFSPSNRARAEFPLSFPLLSCSSSESVSASKLFEGTSFLAFGCLDLRIFVHQPIRWCLHYLYRFLRRTFGLSTTADGVCIFPACIFDAADHCLDLCLYSCKYTKYWSPIVLRVMSGSGYVCVYDLTQREYSESACMIWISVFCDCECIMCGICSDLLRHNYIHCSVPESVWVECAPTWLLEQSRRRSVKES